MPVLPMNVLNVTIVRLPIPQRLVLVVTPAITIMQVPITFSPDSQPIVQVATVNRVGRALLLIMTTSFFLYILANIEESGTAVPIAILPLVIIVYSVVLIAMSIIMLEN